MNTNRTLKQIKRDLWEQIKDIRADLIEAGIDFNGIRIRLDGQTKMALQQAATVAIVNPEYKKEWLQDGQSFLFDAKTLHTIAGMAVEHSDKIFSAAIKHRIAIDELTGTNAIYYDVTQGWKQ